MMLDRGEDQGWFGSTEIVVEAILSIVGFYFFLADSFTSQRPFIPLRIFRDWNFSIAVIFMFIIGIILLATMALVTPYLQNLMGYPVLASGYLLGTRGIGTFVAMMIVGRLLGRIDARKLIFVGPHAGDRLALGDGLLVARNLGARHRHRQRRAGPRPRLRLRAAEHHRLCDTCRASSAPTARRSGR